MLAMLKAADMNTLVQGCQLYITFSFGKASLVEVTDISGNTKWGKYHCTIDLLSGISCMTTEIFVFICKTD
jgi:hypothetical protein